MIGKLKGLGVALLVALTMGAVGAQAASADILWAELEDTVITTEHEGLQFQYGIGTVECETYDFYGTMAATEVTELALTPTYSGCIIFGEEEHFRTNHCSYLLTTETVEGHAPFHVVCEGESEQIEHEIPAFGHCTVTVPQQTAAGGVTFTNNSGELTVSITIELQVTSDNPSANFFCGLYASSEVMTVSGAIRMSGYEYEGGPEVQFVADETATAEGEQGITHWSWPEGVPVAIGVETT